MQVGELFMALGLNVDEKAWNLGQAVVDKMTAELRRLAVSAAMASTDVKKAMTTIGLELPKQKTNFEKIGESGDRVTHTFRNMIAAAAGFFAIGGVKEMITDVVDLGGKLNDAAQATGLSAEELQWWGYAAKQNSSDIDGMIGGTKKLAKGLEEASKTGKGPVADAFHELGISMQDPAIKARDLNGIMFMVANKFSTMPDGAKKTAVSMALFGKTGADLIPTLNSGVQGLMAYRKEADELGGVMSGSTVSALDDVGDNIDRVKFAWQGIKQQAVTALLPMLKDTVESVLAWVKANKELIATKIQETIETVISGVKLMASVVLFAVKHWRALAAVFATMTIVNGMMSIVKAIIWFQSVQAVAAGEALVAWAAILGPVLLVAAAVVGLGALVYKFRDQIYNALTRAGQFFTDLGTKIKESLGGAFDVIRHLPFVEQLFDLVDKLGALAGIGRSIGDKVFDATHGDGIDHSDEGDSPEAAATRAQSKLPYYTSSGATSGASGGRVSAPTVRGGGGGGGPVANVTNSYSVVVNAGSADAKEVGNVVDQKLREHDDRTRRQTAASLRI